MSDHAKRTRSQLSLTDEVGDIHLGISPLKAARQERRKNIPVASPLVSSELHAPPNVGANQNDDGYLLSHHEDRPQKRTSPKPQEDDPERQFKRLKKDHIEGEWDDGAPHAHDLHPEESRVTEATRPSGPFDFSAISPKDLLSPTGSRQLGASWTKRAQSAPLVSPSAPNRNLGQLMPSPRKTASVSPVRETFRFSSLPRALGPFAGDTIVRNVGKPPTEPERDNGLTAPRIPASNDMGTSLREKLTPEADTSRPCDDQFPAAGPSLEVTASDVSLTGPLLPLDFLTTPTTLPKGQDSDITPKATAPVPSSPPGGRLTPVPSSDPLSPLTDDPPSPLSALSSLSELEDNPSLSDYEMRASVEPPSRNSQEVNPPLSSLIAASKSIDALPPVTRPVTGAMEKRETGSLPRDSAARSQSTFSIAPGPSSHKQSFSFAMPTSSSLNKAVERAPANSPQKPWSLPKRQPPKLLSPIKPASSLGAPSRSKYTGLSNLSLALEKLKAAPPSRPATTLGFTRDTDSVIGTFQTYSQSNG
ncbi:hypothetical protein EDB92DRAFT_1942681 [Lactarius akahatsu]|uniref:Uncharacterized protein n=1 Tax=Lactarius akahatsu TaxID=416441 RepID=A0AAD4LN21_9AGAM|nr:hypothetical protein EDB92DRAFT_1942681 [Lactarius akahatsu]